MPIRCILLHHVYNYWLSPSLRLFKGIMQEVGSFEIWNWNGFGFFGDSYMHC